MVLTQHFQQKKTGTAAVLCILSVDGSAYLCVWSSNCFYWTFKLKTQFLWCDQLGQILCFGVRLIWFLVFLNHVLQKLVLWSLKLNLNIKGIPTSPYWRKSCDNFLEEISEMNIFFLESASQNPPNFFFSISSAPPRSLLVVPLSLTLYRRGSWNTHQSPFWYNNNKDNRTCFYGTSVIFQWLLQAKYWLIGLKTAEISRPS